MLLLLLLLLIDILLTLHYVSNRNQHPYGIISLSSLQQF